MSVNKKITLHPKNASGEIVQDTNIFPKTTIDQVYTEDGSTPMGNDYFQKPLSAGNGISISGTTISVDFGETAFKNMILEAAYPVGSIFIATVLPQNNKCPIENTLGGTWERIKDKFLLAAGDTYTAGNTGGSATVSLNTNNLPSHNHSFTSTSVTTAEYTYSFRGGMNTSDPERNAYFKSVSVSGNAADNWTTSASNDYVSISLHDESSYSFGTVSSDSITDGHHTYNTVTVTHKPQTLSISGTISSTGSGTAFSIMPPYLVAYVWKRTA